MTSIVQIGMDVHKNSFTVCCYDIESEKTKHLTVLEPDYKQVIKYIASVRKHYPDGTEFVCGYEAGCLGYSLYNELSAHHVKCVILAPTTMPNLNNQRYKTDKRDAENIAKCMAYHTYKEVYVPSKEDNRIKEYIRMRDDHKVAIKRIKQQILAFCLRFDKKYSKDNWTQTHIKWLKQLSFDDEILQETFEEYLITFAYLLSKIEMLDKRIEEFAHNQTYVERVKRLECFLGIKAKTALSIVVEIGDFNRFATAEHFASYLGLTPGEHSSGDKQFRTGITKAGNGHIRKLLIEAAHGYPRGSVGFKSKELIKRQEGNPPEVIAYADKANERLRKRCYKLMLKGNKNRNVAITATARELSCFIWGMMTDHIA